MVQKQRQKQQNQTIQSVKTKNRKRRKALPPKAQAIKVNNFYDYKEQLFQKFKQFNKSQACKNVKTTLLTLLGRHTPVEYQEKFGFKQQWEMTGQRSYEDGYKMSQAYTWFSVFRMLLFAVCMWGISIAAFFPLQNNLWVKIVLLIVSSIQGIKFLFNLVHLSHRQRLTQLFQLSLGLSYTLLLQLHPTQLLLLPWLSRTLATLLIIQLYLKLSKIYLSIKNYHISSQYRDIVNLFDLFVLLISITHVFGCVLFVTAQLDAQVNWVVKIGIQDREWLEKYVYSVYFSATTLLTVGYGDIAPTNVTEISAILVTEFIGIAIFGYAVNKIGAALSSMKQKSQKLQKDLGTVQNFGKSCHLQPNVICKMRTEVINSKQLDQDLCLQEQNQLLQKFSQDLRERIQIESSMKVLKSSIFMLVNWTGKLQAKIARKLVKEVYKAEEVLPQSFGKQKLYILDKGKVDILNCSKLANRSVFQKVLKSMTACQGDQVLVENVYGYSAVISSRHINLNAIAKETSICYTLTKSDFLDMLSECEQDLQHYHQIKCKIDFSRIPQQIQTPFIVDIRQHYLPSPVHVITKRKHSSIHDSPRTPFARSSYRSKLAITQLNSKTIHLKEDQSLQSYQFIRDTGYSKMRIDNLSKSAVQGQIGTEHRFQSFKVYGKYFRKSNVDNIIGRLRKINYCKAVGKGIAL